MSLTTCDACGGKYAKKEIDWTVAGVYIGKFPASVCSKCGQTLFSMDTCRKMEKIEKEKGVFGIGLKDHLKV